MVEVSVSSCRRRTEFHAVQPFFRLDWLMAPVSSDLQSATATSHKLPWQSVGARCAARESSFAANGNGILFSDSLNRGCADSHVSK